MRCTDDALVSTVDGVGMEILKIGDIVPCGGYNNGNGVISVVVLLCLKKYATLIDIRLYVHGMSLYIMTIK